MAMETAKNVSREPLLRMRRTLNGLLSTQPFFGSLALRLPFVEDRGRVTIASDGQCIRYNPEWVAAASADDIRMTVSRVVLACTLKHHTRRAKRNYSRWQKASQMVTLPIMRDAGLTDQTGGLEMSIEKAYETLPKEDEEEEGDGASASSSSDPGGVGEIMDAPATSGDGNGEGGEGEGDSDGTGVSSFDASAAIKAEEQDWDEAMHQAAQLAIAQGNLPGRVREMVHSAHHSDVDWRTILRRFMSANAKTDYTWAQPNRRHIDSGLYLPSLHSATIPYIVFAIDTSSSLDTRALENIWAEIREAAADLNPEWVTVLQCDTSVHSAEQYTPGELPENLEAVGRGGTAFAPVFEYLADEAPPQFLVYLTDLECSNYGDEPGYPVIWGCCNRRGYEAWLEPPFGEVVEITEENLA